MKHQDLIAIDVHTHAEISCRQPEDDYANDIEEQKKKYFKSGTPADHPRNRRLLPRSRRSAW